MASVKNSVSPIKTEIPVQDIKAENPVKPIERRNLVRATRPQKHPIYDRPKPPPSNALVIVLGVIFWPIALALYVLKNATANRFRP
jgi:hypothetical protein